MYTTSDIETLLIGSAFHVRLLEMQTTQESSSHEGRFCFVREAYEYWISQLL